MGKRKIIHTMVGLSTTTDKQNWVDGPEIDVTILETEQEYGNTVAAILSDGSRFSLEELEELVCSMRMVADNMTGVN